jgi:pimeloyl-ACP methyl ester carboxylesterase
LLKIMRGFELTQAKQRFFYDGLAARPPYPTQIVWGEHDRMLGTNRRRAVQNALDTGAPLLLPARHFLQEDQAPAVVQAIADLALQTRSETSTP